MWASTVQYITAARNVCLMSQIWLDISYHIIFPDMEMCNFPDDTTIYSCDTNIDSVIIKLEIDLQVLLEWYTANSMSTRPSKFQITFLGLERKNK